MYIIRRDIRDPDVRHYITTGHIVASVVGSIAFVAMVCAGTFFIRRHIQRKKKRAALNEEAMQSDSSSEMPVVKDHQHSPLRSIEPEPMAWCDGDGSLRDPSQRQLEILQGAADTIVNVKAADLPTSSSLGNIRDLEATSRLDGPAELPDINFATELPTTTTNSQERRNELDATPIIIANQRAELPGTTNKLETRTVRYDERPPQSSHSHYRDVFVDAPEKLTPRNSTETGGKRPRPVEPGTT
ncbi:hypothetical protein PG990_006801 [Apiospora arundinis]